MRRLLCSALVVFIEAGCREKSSPPPVASAAPSIVSPTPSSSTSPYLTKPARLTPSVVVEQWNQANAKHDAKILGSLYAARVEFYGKMLTNAECAAKKRDAFAKDATYTQSIRDLKLTLYEKGGYTTAHFVKTSTSHGKSTDYPSTLLIDANGLIELESDEVTDQNLSDLVSATYGWCVDGSLADGQIPNDKVKPPFTISALRAMKGVWASSVYKEDATHGSSIESVSCPTSCDRTVMPGGCSYGFRLIDPSMVGVTVSALADWIYVDAVTGTVTSVGLGRSEPLPP